MIGEKVSSVDGVNNELYLNKRSSSKYEILYNCNYINLNAESTVRGSHLCLPLFLSL